MVDLRVKKYVWHEITSRLSFIESEIQSNPYRETIILKYTLVWNSGEIEDRAKISTELLSGEIVK